MKSKNYSIRTELFLDSLLFIIAIIVLALLWENNLLIFGILTLMWILAIAIWHSEEEILLFIAAAIFGPLLEIICISFWGLEIF